MKKQPTTNEDNKCEYYEALFERNAMNLLVKYMIDLFDPIPVRRKSGISSDLSGQSQAQGCARGKSQEQVADVMQQRGHDQFRSGSILLGELGTLQSMLQLRHGLAVVS